MPSTRFRPVWRTVAFALLTPVVALLVFAATASQVLSTSAPALAVRVGPWNAEAKGRLATWLWQDSAGAARASVASLARQALSRSPGNVDALAMTGLLLDRDVAQTDRVFGYAERLSRRNPVTQLYLIERAVDRGDVSGALLHYDRALSTSHAVAPMLYGVLVPAAAQPGILAALVERLRRRPVWWQDFARAFVNQGADPARTLPILLPVLPLDANDEAQRVILTTAIARLIDAGAYRAAVQVHDRALGVRRGDSAVWNGDFSRRNPLPPIDWQLHDEAGLGAAVDRRSAGNDALFVTADADHDGEVARQLLLLAPGRYRITALTGTVQAAPPRLIVACVGKEGAPLVAVPFPAGATAGTLTADIAVPDACSAQWLLVRTSPADVRPATAAWIDDITIARR